MNWKDKLISSEREAFDDLLWQMPSELGLPSYEVKNTYVFSTSRIAPVISRLHPSAGADGEIFCLDMEDNGKGGYRIHDFFVGEDFRGRGLSLIGAKAMFGLACGFGADHLEFPQIYPGVAPFWSALGALPSEPAAELAQEMHMTLAAASDLTAQDRMAFHDILPVAEEEHFRGWRLLSQADLSPAGNAARQKIFTHSCYGDLVLVPSEPGTREILAQRLGVLPAFRPLDRQNPYHSIVAALAPQVSSTAAGTQPLMAA
jgi:hypothetical protein